MTVKIIPIELRNKDERGYLAEYLHDRTGNQLIVFTHAGVVRGRHYHKGMSATKDPEVLVLITGQCRLNWRPADDPQAPVETAEVWAPARVEVPPMVWHEFVALTDCAFVEMNSIAEHVADTCYDP